MHQYIPLLAATFLVPASLLIDTPSLVAHQPLAAEDVKVTVHLVPDDSPYAGQPSLTWFHLMRADGKTVPLSDCNCNLTVYDSQNQVIARPQLAETAVEGHEQPMGTNITFPNAGKYELVFAGGSNSAAFKSFELKVPVTVRP
ncbi:MAG TPA: hypothetical protein V6C57_00060 [Coleofasciculaceae cyanobacterium]